MGATTDLAIMPARPPAIRLRISLGSDWMVERANRDADEAIGGGGDGAPWLLLVDDMMMDDVEVAVAACLIV